MLDKLGQTLYSIFDRVVLHSISDLVEEDCRMRDWAELRLKSDETLERMGLSPDLVRKGPEHWPWRADAPASGGLQH